MLPASKALRSRDPGSQRAGTALLLALLVLLILLAIMAQLVFGTKTDSDVARNDVTLTTMDQAIESAMLEVFDQLETDGQTAASGGASAGAAGSAASADASEPEGSADPAAQMGGAGGAGGAGQEAQSVDSHEDSWGRPQRTQIGDIELRVLVQDEDSKLNLLGMLTADEEQAEKALERLIRVLDLSRESTSEDLDPSEARSMAEAMRTHIRERSRSVLPRPKLATDDEQNKDQGLPISLKEFQVLEPFDESHFRDYRDEDDHVVHSIGSFVTVWTSLASSGGSGSGAGGETQPSGESASPDGEAQGQAGGAEGGTAAEGQSGGDSGGEAQQGAGSEGAQNPAGGSRPGGQTPAGQGAGGSSSKAGTAVNINTAPVAVLKSLIDERDVTGRFWDEVVEYRNLEEEEEDSESGKEEAQEPQYDEFGNEIIQRRVFDSLDELRQVDGYENLQYKARAQLEQLLTTESQVFTIFVTARKLTGRQEGFDTSPRPGEREDLQGNAIVRTVRAVVLRKKQGDEFTIVPLIRWEVLDYIPFPVEDYPDADR